MNNKEKADIVSEILESMDVNLLFEDSFDKIRSAIAKDIDDDKQRQAAKTEMERRKYLHKIDIFKDKAAEQADRENVKSFEVRLFGEDNNVKRDMIYVSWTTSKETKGKNDKVVQFLRNLIISNKLDSYFSGDFKTNLGDEEKENGDRVEVMILKHDHSYDQLKTKSVDNIGQGEPEGDEGGGMGGRF